MQFSYCKGILSDAGNVLDLVMIAEQKFGMFRGVFVQLYLQVSWLILREF